MRVRRLIAITTGLLLLALCVGCTRDPEAKKRKYMESGQRYMQKGKFEEAQLQFRNAVKATPRDPEVYFHLAKSSLALQQWAMAARALDSAIVLKPDYVDARVLLGQLYIAGREFDKAEEQAQAILKADPNSIPGHRLLGDTYVGRPDLAKAESSFKRILEIDPKASFAYVNLAQVEMSTNRRESAEEHLRRAIHDDPGLADAYFYLSTLYGMQGQLPQAQQLLQQGIQSNSGSEALYLKLAEVLYQQGKRDEGAAWLAKLRTQKGDSVQLTKLIGVFFGQHQDPLRALSEFQHGLTLDKNNLDFRNGLTEAYLSTGKLSEAAAVSAEALKQSPTNLVARILSARIRMAQGNPGGAIAALQQLPEAPEAALAHYILGAAYVQSGQPSQAVSEYQTAVRMAPGMTLAWRGLAEVQLGLGNLQVAQQNVTQALSLTPSDPGLHLLQGQILLRQGNARRAREQFELVAKAFPGDPVVHINVGLTYASEKRVADAEREYELALKASPRSAEALGALVDLYVRNKQEQKAEARLKQHLAANGNDANAHLMLGSSYVRQKRLGEATPEFQRSLQLDPRLAGAHLALGSVLQQQGQIDAAIDRYRKVLELQPRLPAVQVMLGNLLLDKGDLNSARKYYEDAWAAAPNFGIAAGNLAWIYAEQGTNLDVALNLAQKARQLSPDLDGVADTLGWVYYKRSAYALAVPLFRECLRKAPDRAIYHYHLGMALMAQGDKQHARTELQSALRLKLAGNDARNAQAALAKL